MSYLQPPPSCWKFNFLSNGAEYNGIGYLAYVLCVIFKHTYFIGQYNPPFAFNEMYSLYIVRGVTGVQETHSEILTWQQHQTIIVWQHKHTDTLVLP